MKSIVLKTVVLSTLLVGGLFAETEDVEVKKKSCKASCTSHCCQNKEAKSCTPQKSTCETKNEFDDHMDID